MAKGFDTSTPLTASLAALFAAQGYGFVGRYLAPLGSWKRLTAAEANAISAAGLFIVSFFERYAERAREGAAAGAEDGCLALQLAQEVGQPEGSTIYFTVDYDAGPGDYDAIEAYMRAADEQIIGYELGIYGPHAVIKAMFERGVSKKLMQACGWNYAKSDYPNASIYQSKIDIVVNGIRIDLDESNGDAGGWQVGMAIKQAPALDAGVANTIINTWIKPDWEDAEKRKACASPETVAALTEQQRYYNWLANQLRRASGQPEE
jgi:hypothetical protein